MFRKVKNFGKELIIQNNDDFIIFKMKLKDNIVVDELLIESVFSSEKITVPVKKDGDFFTIKLESDLLNKLPLYELSDKQCEEYKITRNNEQDFLKVYVGISNCKKTYEGKVRKLESGKFLYELESFDSVRVEGESNKIYLEKEYKVGYFILRNCQSLLRVKQVVKKAKLKKEKLYIKGSIYTNKRVSSINFLFKGRDDFQEYKLLTNYSQSKEIDSNLYKSDYVIDVNINEFIDDNFIPDTYGAFLDIEVDGEINRIRQSRINLRNRLRVKKTYIRKRETTYNITPLFSFKGKILSLQVDDFDNEAYDLLLKKQRTRFFDRIINRKRDIWLVGERIYKAQDNGYFFFKYMRENFPDKEVYYIIDKDSSEKKNVQKYGNVIDFKSKEHIELSLLANKFITTHHYEYILPLRDKKFKKKLKGARVFLQHGVMGTKYMANLYGDNLSSFTADSFIVSSEKEKRYIHTDFHYDNEKIHVSGLARYDRLFEECKQDNKILIIPTWRDWLQNLDAFKESEYFKRYQDLINNEKLAKLAKDNNLKIVFCLHPNMQQFSELFKSDNVEIVFQGQINVQDLLMESKLLITDYSSIGFDFSFLSKPVIYYMFDREEFFGEEGSHLEVDIDLPGQIVSSESQIVSQVEGYIRNNFEMNDEYYHRASQFIQYRDCDNSKRIKEVVELTKRDNSLKRKLKKSSVLNLIGRKINDSRYRGSIMKRLYKLMRLLPMKNVVLFEANQGKSFGDSPKEIYESLIEKCPNIKKVWVVNGQRSIIEKSTIKVKRLSFSYFYYLARAKYLVTNQNFPHYIKRRKNQLLIQTWHGTPLKKMFYDLKEIYGRDAGYKKRTAEAIQQWSHLVSPNEYSTDIFKSAFKHNAKVLEVGYPRNDYLYRNNNNEFIQNIKKRLNIKSGSEVILYAPTFRDDSVSSVRGRFNHELMLDLKKLYNSLNENQVFLVRMHAVVSENIIIPEEYQEKIINVSDYPNTEDLLLVSDLLITDYSSIFFDFLNLEKPIVFYAYDLDNYQNKLRGFYFEYREENLPGPITTNDLEVYSILNDINLILENNKDKIIELKKKYCGLDDGYASKRVIEKIK